MFLSFACWPRSTHGWFDVWERRDTCSVPALLSRAALYLPPPQAIRAALALSAVVGECQHPSAVESGAGSPLSPAPLESFHGFADGPPGCQSAGSFPALFIRLRQRLPFSPAERTRVLLSQYLGDELTDLSRLPHSKS